MMDRFIDVLGLAVFAGGVLDEGPCREYVRGKIKDLNNWMFKKYGIGEMLMKVSAAALDHFLAAFKQEEN